MSKFTVTNARITAGGDLLVNGDKGRTALRTTMAAITDVTKTQSHVCNHRFGLRIGRRSAFLLPLDIDFGDDKDERDRVYSKLSS
jgi:hypothetical protein